MEPLDLLRILVATLERLGIDYLVTGSMATIAYVEQSRRQQGRSLPVGPD